LDTVNNVRYSEHADKRQHLVIAKLLKRLSANYDRFRLFSGMRKTEQRIFIDLLFYISAILILATGLLELIFVVIVLAGMFR